jgi:hypothetical protein
MELIPNKLIKHGFHAYILSDEMPVNGDMVMTENHGVWEFRDETGTGSAPLPYWANWKTCRKIVATDDKELKEKRPDIILILKK